MTWLTEWLMLKWSLETKERQTDLWGQAGAGATLLSFLMSTSDSIFGHYPIHPTMCVKNNPVFTIFPQIACLHEGNISTRHEEEGEVKERNKQTTCSALSQLNCTRKKRAFPFSLSPSCFLVRRLLHLTAPYMHCSFYPVLPTGLFFLLFTKRRGLCNKKPKYVIKYPIRI